jgi:hypothetical protein
VRCGNPPQLALAVSAIGANRSIGLLILNGLLNIWPLQSGGR